MTSDCARQTNVTDEAELHQFIVDAVAAHRGGSSDVVRIGRQLYDYRSSFAIEEATVYFADGAVLPLIFKSLSPDCLLSHARAVRPAHGYDPAREIIVYRELLPHLSLGAPRCYGAVAEASRGRYWLLLEKAPGSDLARSGNFAIWASTAQWLAAAHQTLTAAFSQCTQRQRLMRYDYDCFSNWIDNAERSLRRPQRAGGGAVEPWEIAWLVERSRAAARLASSLPPSLIHGDFYPSNVLISEAAPQLRICTLDWETAGIGPALLDLAALVSGSWNEQQRAELSSYYFDAEAETAAPPAGKIDQLMALRCCRLMLARKWIGWSPQWQPPTEHRHDWLAEALELARELNSYLEPIKPSLRTLMTPWNDA
jgi:Ser/Thr protein kinase RdoA (MazF antagonist)